MDKDYALIEADNKRLREENKKLLMVVSELQQTVADMDKAYREKLENIWCHLDGTWHDIQKIKNMCMNPYDEDKNVEG